MIARIRKAVTAGVLAAAAATGSAIFTALPDGLTQDEISKAIGVGIAALVVTGWATYRVPNAPMPPAPPRAR